MEELEKLIAEKNMCDEKMGEILNAPPGKTRDDRKKSQFMYAYYDFHFRRLEKEIQEFVKK